MEYVLKEKTIAGRCLECGNEMTYAKKNKKFCGNICRSRYHNRQIHYLKSVRTRVQAVLDKNHFILDALLKKGIQEADINELMVAGFAEHCFTSFRKGRYRDEYGCYDIGYYIRAGRLMGLHRIYAPTLSQMKYPELKKK